MSFKCPVCGEVESAGVQDGKYSDKQIGVSCYQKVKNSAAENLAQDLYAVRWTKKDVSSIQQRIPAYEARIKEINNNLGTYTLSGDKKLELNQERKGLKVTLSQMKGRIKDLSLSTLGSRITSLEGSLTPYRRW